MSRSRKYLIFPLKIRYFLDKNKVLAPYGFWIKFHILFFDY
jgi:hypothetical protein